MFNLRELILITEALDYLWKAQQFAVNAVHATDEERADAQSKLDDIEAIMKKVF